MTGVLIVATPIESVRRRDGNGGSRPLWSAGGSRPDERVKQFRANYLIVGSPSVAATNARFKRDTEVTTQVLKEIGLKPDWERGSPIAPAATTRWKIGNPARPVLP
jgi:hypothetical protein